MPITQIEVGEIIVDIVRKDIRSVHISVHTPDGTVRISAPRRMPVELVTAFAMSKLGWINRQQERIRARVPERQAEFVEGERHMVWGQLCLLEVIEKSAVPRVELLDGKLVLMVRPGVTTETRTKVISEWYRKHVAAMVPSLVSKWEMLLGVQAKGISIRKMTTRWGSCSPKRKTIRLSSELAKKPPECLEYVILHELVHLLEPSHNKRFVALMDRWMPKWRDYKSILKKVNVK